jgi:hypothetical protein
MTDRELLEFAAKAAGIEVVRSRLDDPLTRDLLVMGSVRNTSSVAGPWNPLTDDGDALRLAAKLNLWGAVRDGYQHIDSDGDFYAATRRSIVRAAAEIGRATP